MRLKKTIVLKYTLNCNLRCKYCYEFNRLEHEQLNSDIIREKEMCNMIEKYASIFKESEILWMLHGGEPLLLNKKAFKNICEKVREVNLKYNVNYKLALQTNGTLIDNEWVSILENDIELFSERTISLSIDGPEYINDVTRIDRTGNGTYKKVEENIKKIKNCGLDVTTISVVGKHNIDKVEEVYKKIKDIGPNFAKFIPCYNFDKNGNVENYGINPMEYCDFICKIFDLWIRDITTNPNQTPIAIDPIVTIISSITNSPITWCEYSKNKCNNFITMFPNGDLWLCDTFNQEIHKEYGYLGNYFKSTDKDIFNMMQKTENYCLFNRFNDKMTGKCNNCEVESICKGGCLPQRDSLKSKSGKLFNEYCESKKKMISYIKEAVEYAMSKC